MMTILDKDRNIFTFNDSYVEMLTRKATEGKPMTKDEQKDWELIQPIVSGSKKQSK